MTLGTSRVYVASRRDTSGWEDAQTGEARSSVEIVIDDVILLDRPTPTATPEDAQDAGEPQLAPRTSAPSPRPETDLMTN